MLSDRFSPVGVLTTLSTALSHSHRKRKRAPKQGQQQQKRMAIPGALPSPTAPPTSPAARGGGGGGDPMQIGPGGGGPAGGEELDLDGAGSGEEAEAEARARGAELRREEKAAAQDGDYDRAADLALTLRAIKALGLRVVEHRKARELAVTAEQYHRAAVCQRRLEALEGLRRQLVLGAVGVNEALARGQELVAVPAKEAAEREADARHGARRSRSAALTDHPGGGAALHVGDHGVGGTGRLVGPGGAAAAETECPDELASACPDTALYADVAAKMDGAVAGWLDAANADNSVERLPALPYLAEEEPVVLVPFAIRPSPQSLCAIAACVGR